MVSGIATFGFTFFFSILGQDFIYLFYFSDLVYLNASVFQIYTPHSVLGMGTKLDLNINRYGLSECPKSRNICMDD